MGLSAYLWMKDGAVARPGNVDEQSDQHFGWIELKDYVHKIGPNSHGFDIMKKLDNNTPWMSQCVMTGATIERALLHSVSDHNTLTLYEMENLVLLSTESREDDEEQADQVSAAIQTIAANSGQTAPTDEWTVAPYTSYSVEESADRYELFEAVCGRVKLTHRQRDRAGDTGLDALTQSILSGSGQLPDGFFTSD